MNNLRLINMDKPKLEEIQMLCIRCGNSGKETYFSKDQLRERIKIWNSYKDDERLFFRECEDRDIYLSYVDWLNNLSDKVLDNTDPWKDWLFNYCFEEILKE